MAEEAKRITVEVDRWELAAILNMHSARVAKLGAEAAAYAYGLDKDDLECASQTAVRIQELLKRAHEFR